jgi:hypothetical protein
MFEAMNEFGVDTLKAARALEEAGLKTRMYQLMLAQTVVIVGLIVSLDRLL